MSNRSALLVAACAILTPALGFVPSLSSPLVGRSLHKLSKNNLATFINADQYLKTVRLFATTVTPVEEQVKSSTNDDITPKIRSIAFLLPSENFDSKPSKFGGSSPVGNPSLLEAAQHLCKKATWFSDGTVDTILSTVPSDGKMISSLETVDVLIAMGLESEQDLQYAQQLFQTRKNRDASLSFRQCQFALDCAKDLPATVGPFDPVQPSLQAGLVPWSDAASGKRFLDQMQGLFDRWTSDDFTVALMLFFNRFSGAPVDWVKDSQDATWEKGPLRNAKEFYNMVTKCGDCINKCLQDEDCKECIEKLAAMDTRDQAASYRTLVSYESELLKDFSYCILTKNNIFGCTASIPKSPEVKPITSWRGTPLTSEAARSIFIAHLDDEKAPEGSLRTDVSWKVACGANVAYDQFPSQNQIFYESVNGRDMWYDPVFRVETLDGRQKWCKRHYKVRDAKEPGTFKLSVLDNGVTSSEFWTIGGAADDLSWAVFHYAGAAKAVGQRYMGGLLCTPDGTLPAESSMPEIWKAFQSVGIEPWELFVVNNDPKSEGLLIAGAPPLDFYRKDVLAAKAAKQK